jgi:hypothetical protein
MRKIKEEELSEHRKKMYFDRIIKNPGSSCWGWKGTLDKDGYGKFSSKRKGILAHRFSWEINFGEIPKGLIVGHHCDSPHCTRPDHLYLGTTLHNSNDMVRKNRQAKGSKNGGSKLNEISVKEIKKMIQEKIIVDEIAKIFNVHRCTIYRIKRKKHWRHVEC